MHAMGKLTMPHCSLNARINPDTPALISAIQACISRSDNAASLSNIAGLTGLAFRLNIDATVSLGSMACCPWQAELPAMLTRLGWQSTCIYSAPYDPLFNQAKQQAIDTIAQGLAKNMPSILWGVQVPEFGIVYGQDTEQFLVSGILDNQEGTQHLHYEHLGQSDIPMLLTITPQQQHAITTQEAAFAALSYIVEHLYNKGPCLGGYVTGLQAYASWISALEQGIIDPAGHIHTLQAIASLRPLTSPFLQQLCHNVDPLISEQLTTASHAYQTATTLLLELVIKTPRPEANEITITTSYRDNAIDLLKNICSAETRAAEALLQAVTMMHEKHRGSVTIHQATNTQELFHCVRDLPLDHIERDANTLQTALQEQLGKTFFAKIARTTTNTIVGHLYYAPLEHSKEPIEVQGNGSYWFVYCPWVNYRHQHCGIGQALMNALCQEAKKNNVDGIFAEATQQELFLGQSSWEILGFKILNDQNKNATIMYKAISNNIPTIKQTTVSNTDKLSIHIQQHRPCPLLQRTNNNMKTAALRLKKQGLSLTIVQNDSDVNQISIGQKRLPLSYISIEVAQDILHDIASRR